MAADPEGVREAARKRARAWRSKNPDKARATSRQSRQKHIDIRRESARQRVSEWQKNNPAKARAINAARRARKRMAMPSWVDRQALAAIYAEAAIHNLVVDHIIPLTHPLVCGLHVPWNLQLLTAGANYIKGNRWEC